MDNDAYIDAYANALQYTLEGVDPYERATKEVREIEHTAFSVNAKKPKLKPLPSNLKYAFLDDNEMHPLIVSDDLSESQLAILLVVFRRHRKAIGYSLDDLKGISSEFLMHRIHLEEEHKSSAQGQRRLNPIMHEVVKREVMKLLDAGIIFPIASSEWVSPIQVLPKKEETIVIRNAKKMNLYLRELLLLANVH